VLKGLCNTPLALGGGNTRIVLGDWYEQGSGLRVDAEGLALATFQDRTEAAGL